MSEVMRMLGEDEPLMVAWERFKASPDYTEATAPSRFLGATEGSLWRVFMAGFIAATELAAAKCESVNAASDRERADGSPGAGAMGAVIEYRDLIRKALP